jgi:hypothetical protein
MTLVAQCRDDRGIALPMALMMLMLLTTLITGFALLSQSEPVIASNHLRVTQARAHADAGLERAIWALSQGVIVPGLSGSLAYPLPGPVPAPYDGSTFLVSGGTGGFFVGVTTPDAVNKPDERLVVSTGWTPTFDVADGRTKAHRKIQAVVERFPDLGLNAPCALCVRGDVGVGGNALIDATQDTSCGSKYGTYSAGRLDRSGSADVSGADGNSTPNQPSDYRDNVVDPHAFDGVTLSASNFKALRDLARKNGTYFGPGSPNGTPATSPAWTGSVSFTASNKVKNGIVFIDTVSGQDIPTDISAQNPADFASVAIHGNPFVSDDFTGWIVVNGTLQISGNMKINGLVYVVNDLTYNGAGTGEIRGLAISQNVRDVVATQISSDDTQTTGNSRIKFNCSNARARDVIPAGFTLQAGTYREISD